MCVSMCLYISVSSCLCLCAYFFVCVFMFWATPHGVQAFFLALTRVTPGCLSGTLHTTRHCRKQVLLPAPSQRLQNVPRPSRSPDPSHHAQEHLFVSSARGPSLAPPCPLPAVGRRCEIKGPQWGCGRTRPGPLAPRRWTRARPNPAGRSPTSRSPARIVQSEINAP